MKQISKNIIQFITFLCVTLIISSCNKLDFNKEIEDSYIEFESTNLIDTVSYKHTGNYVLSIPVQFFGKSISNNETIEIEISELSNLAENYNLVYSKSFNTKELSITDTIKITLKPTYIFSETAALSVTLKGNSKIKTTEYTNTCKVTIIKQTFSGFYSGNYTCYESKTGAIYSTTFSKIDNASIKNHNFWDFPDLGQTVTYILDRDSSLVEIPESEFVDKLNNTYLVSGSGELYENGDFKVNYILKTQDEQVYQEGEHYFKKN